MKVFFFLCVVLTASLSFAADYVVVVSVDGLRKDAIETLMAGGELPTFSRLQREGVWTHNARTDYHYTATLPNHACMITGRPVLGGNGHAYTSNGNPASSETYHSNKGSYVAGFFDVAHDHGLTTAFHRSKSKLVIVDQSYSAIAGAADTTGDDNGAAKIDVIKFNETDEKSDVLVEIWKTDMLASPIDLSFVHLVDTDRAGHGGNWDNPDYMDAVRRIDSYLKTIMDTVDGSAPYSGRTTLIVTADHGGEGSAHSNASDSENYTIPLYVWGADIHAAGDLYALNSASRLDPGTGRPLTSAAIQPVRNGDAGNLALDLLGLPSIPDSFFNVAQDLNVTDPESNRVAIQRLPAGDAQLRWATGVSATVKVSEDLVTWENAQGDWPMDTGYWIDAFSEELRYYRVVLER